MTDVSTSLIQAAYIVAAVLFILSLAGLSKHETARRRQRVRHDRHGHRPRRDPLARPARCSVAATSSPWPSRWPSAPRSASGARARRDDRHARAGRHAAQLRRRWRRCSSGSTPSSRPAARGAVGSPPRRGLPRRLHRRGDVHRARSSPSSSCGANLEQAADAAGAALAQPRCPRRVRRRCSVGSWRRTRSCRCSS